VVTCIPETPRFASEAERTVWRHLRAHLRQGDVLVANQRFTDVTKDHEIDLLVLLEGYGVVAVEVKGGSISHDGHGWTRRQLGADVRIDPVGQARDSRYAARQYVETDSRWQAASRSRLRWGHAVVFPDVEVDADFAAPDCPRWLVHGRSELGALAQRLRALLEEQHTHNRAPDADDISLLVDILRGRNRPAHSVAAEADDRGRAIDRLTQEQLALLRVTRMLNRVEVRGGAGSGKTVMALAQARQLTHGRDGIKAQRVALICYSRGLAAHFRRETATWGRKDRPAFVGRFEELALQWGVRTYEQVLSQWHGPEPAPTVTDYYERLLPEEMARVAADVPEGQRFDAVIVDEAQDFADLWWVPVLGALRDQQAGGLYLYSDVNQRVFARFGEPPVPLVILMLDHNLRNTRQIGELINPLAPNRMRLLGGSGPEVTFVPCSAAEAIDVADDHVDTLLEEGWSPREVALLTVGTRHELQRDAAENDPDAYWASFWDDDMTFYGHVLGCKGLERRAVVLCVNKDQVQPRDRERLYVGLSRATDRLVVVGDPDYIARVCGAEVAARLGLPSSA